MKAIPKIFVILSLSAGVFPATFCSPTSSNYQVCSLTADIFLSTSAGDKLLVEDFLVTGADTLSYEQAYQTKRLSSGWNNSMAYGSEYYVAEPFHWSSRLLRFHIDVNYHGRYHTPLRTGSLHDDSFNPDSPFYSFSPISRWLEFARMNTTFDAERVYYNYQYYIGPSPVAAEVNRGYRDASHRGNRRGFIGISVLSAVLMVLSLN